MLLLCPDHHVTQADGNQAWSSPIYLIAGASLRAGA